ncbi:MAG: hypothetical protein JWQ34_324 [Mucilaginibacter sp.]|uniref:hypothetical protein n=1 Tax=Mucilaginibacter sp. TaxID=1882438 RepID=UPI0026102616|nr:hypothetical protein [Mucilaginibacter sp.]MDB5002099.1 hypothetical protein [Mucilaginibacter sp.]
MTTISLLAGIYTFFQTHEGDIASKMIASAGYDILKKSLDFKSLKDKIGGFFKKKEDQDEFIKQLCDVKIDNETNTEQSVKSTYEKITGDTFQPEIINLIKEWMSQHHGEIQNLNNITISNSTGFNIGVQSAQGNIVNVQGDYNINHNKDED